MAEKVTGMRVEGTIVGGADTQRGRRFRGGVAAYGLMTLAIVAVLLLGVALHERQASPAGSAAITAVVQPAISGEQQKFSDMNTTWLQSLGSPSPYMESITPQYGANR